jgi:hypothetical protein
MEESPLYAIHFNKSVRNEVTSNPFGSGSQPNTSFSLCLLSASDR